MKEVYYKPSGKFSLVFIPYFILLQALAIPLLSIIYIYLIYYIPIVYLNFLITLGCGIAAGLVMTGIMHIGKVRNNKAALLFSILAVCVMKYVQWCVYIPIVLSNAYEMYELTVAERFGMSFDLLLYPSMVFEMVEFINQVGVWSLSTYTVKGILLMLVWLLEFILITVAACFVSLEKSKFPFCEEEGEWYVEMPNKIGAGMPENFNSIKKDMESGDFSELIRLVQEYQPGGSQYLCLSFCKTQDSAHHYMKIKRITVTKDKGKEKTSEETLIEYLSIDNGSVGAILGLA